jgi:hypothetical protein
MKSQEKSAGRQTFFCLSPEFELDISKIKRKNVLTMKLEQYLIKNRIRAEELSRRSGVHGSCITRFLNRQRRLSPISAAKISDATSGSVGIMELLFPDGLPESDNDKSIEAQS